MNSAGASSGPMATCSTFRRTRWSMSRKDRGILIVAVAGLLSGCADYLNNYDTVTLAAGDAQKQNMLLHTKDPFNPASRNTAIDTDGQRAADAVRSYRTSQQPGAAPAEPAQQQGDTTGDVGTPATTAKGM